MTDYEKNFDETTADRAVYMFSLLALIFGFLLGLGGVILIIIGLKLLIDRDTMGLAVIAGGIAAIAVYRIIVKIDEAQEKKRKEKQLEKYMRDHVTEVTADGGRFGRLVFEADDKECMMILKDGQLPELCGVKVPVSADIENTDTASIERSAYSTACAVVRIYNDIDVIREGLAQALVKFYKENYPNNDETFSADDIKPKEINVYPDEIEGVYVVLDCDTNDMKCYRAYSAFELHKEEYRPNIEDY